jgi:hypothetical protein
MKAETTRATKFSRVIYLFIAECQATAASVSQLIFIVIRVREARGDYVFAHVRPFFLSLSASVYWRIVVASRHVSRHPTLRYYDLPSPEGRQHQRQPTPTRHDIGIWTSHHWN